MTGPRVDYTGQRFGLVTVVRRHGKKQVLCRCDCGAERYMHVANVMISPPKTHVRCTPVVQYELEL